MSQVTDDYVMTEFNRLRRITEKQQIEIDVLKRELADLKAAWQAPPVPVVATKRVEKAAA